ncbi:hypothetical protein GJ496_011956 [Pomphorhynchus laevis]|nr:hypothetical protein GJ496_011956 [Pomphorhynchus laevis]
MRLCHSKSSTQDGVNDNIQELDSLKENGDYYSFQPIDKLISEINHCPTKTTPTTNKPFSNFNNNDFIDLRRNDDTNDTNKTDKNIEYNSNKERHEDEHGKDNNNNQENLGTRIFTRSYRPVSEPMLIDSSKEGEDSKSLEQRNQK